ncbi:hypothetical protein DLAC_02399 [Tieghemostelium lacteum]|uniref:Uncharacterized protein n=1 Tax=Tieghemostelium lacteum TaxID=361077 RepID=A0A152A4V5_TIELA|nr:hypothetical protein DLAC_02399 [Tieghemostelium lacteum]|eukprot:KYR01276.1 hypothetical protein DLAC_02399 [Tieghemostelium lacteum]
MVYWQTMAESQFAQTLFFTFENDEIAYFRFTNDDNSTSTVVTNLDLYIDSKGQAEKCEVYLSFDGLANKNDHKISGLSTPFNFTACYQDMVYMTIQMENPLFSGDIQITITPVTNSTKCVYKDVSSTSTLSINMIFTFILGFIVILFNF